MKRIAALFRPNHAPIHSHAITKASAPTTFGSTSPESFSQRRSVEKNRQAVSSYRYANIHQTDVTLSQRQDTSVRQASSRKAMDVFAADKKNAVSRPDSSAGTNTAAQRVFREPSSHRHNPYG